MPYSITEDAPDCDGYAVVKDADGEVMGCHETEEEAAEQIAAIEASEGERAGEVDTTPPQYMQDAAQRGLEMHEEGKGGEGLEGATVREAQRMAAGEDLTEAKVRKGNAFWGRNEGYCNDDASDAQVTSRLLWGGCQSIDWFDRKYQSFEDPERMHRADPEDLSTGDRVEWSASGGTAYGEIETVETDGTVSAEPEGPTMEGTEDDPAYGVRVYQPGEEGWEASDVLTVHRAGALTKIEGFPDEEAGGMMEDEQRGWTSDAEIRMASDGERTTVQVMTEDIARDGMILRADGVDTEAYMDNPVVLWNHGADPQRGAVPIAKTVDMQRVDGGLRATVEWAEDEFAQEIKRKVKRGFISAVSFAWKTEEAEQKEVDGRSVPVISRSDMTEFSFVGVPADKGALVIQRSRDDLESLVRSAVRDEVKKTLGTAATAATPRTDSEPTATAGGSAEVQRDDTPDYDLDEEKLVRTIDRIIKRKIGKA